MPRRSSPRARPLWLLIGLGLGASAQGAPLPLGAAPAGWSVGLRAGWDSAAVLGLQGTGRLSEKAQLEASVERPLSGRGNGAAGLGAAWSWGFGGGPWGLGLQGSTGLARAAPVTGPQLAWTVEAALRPGWFRADRHAALWLGGRGAPATHIRHSDVVHDLFDDRYPEGAAAAGGRDGPQDGWVRGAAQTYRLGASGGRRWGGLGLSGAASFDWTPQRGGVVMNGMLGTLPFSALLELSWCR